MLTPEHLAEIEARAEAATEGPWTEGQDSAVWNARIYGPPNSGHRSTSLCEVLQNGAGDAANNRAFIAHARTDIPDLLAAYKAAQEENERLKAAIIWIDTSDPQTTEAANRKFSLKMEEW